MGINIEAPGSYAGSLASVLRSLTLGEGLLRPVISAGKLVVGFGTGIWLNPSAAPIAEGHTGYDASGDVTGVVSRTGQPEMLVWEPASDAVLEINLGNVATAASKLRTAALGGNFGLWVHVASQPGYEPSGSLKGSIAITLTTDTGTGSNANALTVSYNINQVREGWNFLKFVQRNPAAYVAGSGETEYHPFGVAAGSFGTGGASDILNSPITGLKIGVSNFGGATLTFDSFVTGISSGAQIVLGCDAGGADLVDDALPLFQSYGWTGYTAVPARIWDGTESRIMPDLTVPSLSRIQETYAAGWENINHTTNHLPGAITSPKMAELTSAGEIAYELEHVKGLYAAKGLARGVEFYASPQSSSSRLTEKVIAGLDFIAQRHARKPNVSVTPWGVDNLHHLGSSDIGSAAAAGVSSVTSGVASSVVGWQVFSKIKRMVDVIEAYGDTWFPFWHGITHLGDSGSGEDLTGDNLLMTYSAFQMTLDYIAEREAAGGLRVRDGFTGWYYGVGR
ncbi:MAG TPA: hypothetical protein VGN60_09080 [Devosia sp.]|jgi:hypothetical protein|nr:hypothetical protein [Devosia sp.]